LLLDNGNKIIAQNYNLKKFNAVLKYFFLTVLVILTSCGGSKVPENLIQPEQMTKILMEVHLLESKIGEVSIVPYDSTQKVYEHYEELLFEDLGVTQEMYETSFNYYLDHPRQFEKIYNAVVDSLLQKEKTTK